MKQGKQVTFSISSLKNPSAKLIRPLLRNCVRCSNQQSESLRHSQFRLQGKDYQFLFLDPFNRVLCFSRTTHPDDMSVNPKTAITTIHHRQQTNPALTTDSQPRRSRIHSSLLTCSPQRSQQQRYDMKQATPPSRSPNRLIPSHPIPSHPSPPAPKTPDRHDPAQQQAHKQQHERRRHHGAHPQVMLPLLPSLELARAGFAVRVVGSWLVRARFDVVVAVIVVLVDE